MQLSGHSCSLIATPGFDVACWHKGDRCIYSTLYQAARWCFGMYLQVDYLLRRSHAVCEIHEDGKVQPYVWHRTGRRHGGCSTADVCIEFLWR